MAVNQGVISSIQRKQVLKCFGNVYYQVEILKERAWVLQRLSLPLISLSAVRKQTQCYLWVLKFCCLFLLKQFISVKLLCFKGKPSWLFLENWLFLTNHPFYLPSCHLWELSCEAASQEPSPGLISSWQITDSWHAFCLWLHVTLGFRESEIKR